MKHTYVCVRVYIIYVCTYMYVSTRLTMCCEIKWRCDSVNHWAGFTFSLMESDCFAQVSLFVVATKTI